MRGDGYQFVISSTRNEDREERKMWVDNLSGRAEKHSGSGRVDKVLKATEEGVIEWR